VTIPSLSDLSHTTADGMGVTILLLQKQETKGGGDLSRNTLIAVFSFRVHAAADAYGQHLEVLTASTQNQLDTAFGTMVRQRIEAHLVKADPFFIYQRERLAALAAHSRSDRRMAGTCQVQTSRKFTSA
jgi:hypothetical protein